MKLLAGPKSATEADSEPLPLPFGFQPKTGTALVGCDNERKLVVVVASESVTHKGYWHISALDTDGHAIVAYMLPIESVWLTEALGTVMEESRLEPGDIDWEVTDGAIVASLQALCEDDAAFVWGQHENDANCTA